VKSSVHKNRQFELDALAVMLV